ncbi:MAG: flagellar export chaperone FliS [Sporomusaceae bacterium]|nr:flagellar export chaperone FliS [Sporomusaceae bacterium]
MNAAVTANTYKNQQILTASPEELTLMLYNGAVRFANESIKALEKGNIEQANTASQRVQDIVREFMSTLDMQYEISKNLFALYEYIDYRLIQANIHKDAVQLTEARDLLVELRDTWIGAMKQTQLARAVGR